MLLPPSRSRSGREGFVGDSHQATPLRSGGLRVERQAAVPHVDSARGLFVLNVVRYVRDVAILELLGGAALEQILGGGIAAVKRFFNQTPRGRLLTLLHAEFGEESRLERDVFLDWPKHKELSQPLDDLLAGRRQPDHALAAELARAIEPRLFRTPEGERPELAVKSHDVV